MICTFQMGVRGDKLLRYSGPASAPAEAPHFHPSHMFPVSRQRHRHSSGLAASLLKALQAAPRIRIELTPPRGPVPAEACLLPAQQPLVLGTMAWLASAGVRVLW